MQLTPHYCKLGERPAVVALLNEQGRDSIQEWCNHWCMILNPNKTKTLDVWGFCSRYSLPRHHWCEIWQQAYFDDLMLGIVYRVSQRTEFEFAFKLIFWGGMKHVFLETSVLLHCNCAFVLPILEYCSMVWGSATECHIQLLERQAYSVARLAIFRVYCHCVLLDCVNRNKVNSNSNHCLFSELPSAYTRVRHIWAAGELIHLSLKYQGGERHCLQGVSCRLWFVCGITFPTLCSTVEDWMGLGVHSPLVAISELYFFSFLWRRCLWGCESNL